MDVLNRKVLLGDIFYSMIGMGSGWVKVRRNSGFLLSVHESLSQDERQVVHGLADILLGVREVKHKIEEAYYTKEYTKRALLKGLEAEVDAFARRVAGTRAKVLRRDSGQGPEVGELLFLFQDDLVLFKAIRKLLRELDKLESIFLLQVVIDNEVFWKSGFILAAVLAPVNRVLRSLVEGKKTAEYFEERNTYGYEECFWSSCYKKKPLPEYLADKIDGLFLLGKLSKVRALCQEPLIPCPEDIIVQKEHVLYFNEHMLREYYVRLLSSYAVYSMWKDGVAEFAAVLLLGADRYSEMFKELGSRVFCTPTAKEISFINYLLRRGSLSYSAVEERIDSQSLSFMSDSSFLLNSLDQESLSPIGFVYDSTPLHHLLSSIQKTKIAPTSADVSLLQGLSAVFSPKKPLSLFFSTKTLLEVKIVFRLIYSLYAIEHVLCHYYSDWKIRHPVLAFVTGVRMHITEQMKKEIDGLGAVTDPTQYCAALENAFASIMRASLLTTPALVQFYCQFLSLSFSYIGIEHREHLAAAEVRDILAKYKQLFREALPYVKQPFLYLIFESLTV